MDYVVLYLDYEPTTIIRVMHVQVEPANKVSFTQLTTVILEDRPLYDICVIKPSDILVPIEPIQSTRSSYFALQSRSVFGV